MVLDEIEPYVITTSLRNGRVVMSKRDLNRLKGVSMQNLTHIYTGDGKGKTTAAVGLSIRCAGSGGEVLFTQFLKDNKSSELSLLQKIENITVILCDETFGFYSRMEEETKKRAKVVYHNYLQTIIEKVRQQEYVMLVLDEIIGAYNYNLIDRKLLLEFLQGKPDGLEVVMTGRNPHKELVELADYVSEIVKVKHPFDKGVIARRGIEK